MNRDGKSFLGAGWSFPVGIDNARGGIEVARDAGDIEQSIRIIVGTAKGERRMRPEFGCSVHDLVFAPNNTATASMAAYYVREALGQWEPRIEVMEVRAEADREDPARLLINVQYVVRGTNEERNLVYPFYRIPQEE